jgi:hypothetical protein
MKSIFIGVLILAFWIHHSQQQAFSPIRFCDSSDCDITIQYIRRLQIPLNFYLFLSNNMLAKFPYLIYCHRPRSIINGTNNLCEVNGSLDSWTCLKIETVFVNSAATIKISKYTASGSLTNKNITSSLSTFI